MRIIFLGTPDIALDTFRTVVAEFDVAALLTQPDRPVGRSRRPMPSVLSVEAEGFGIDVYKPEKITDDLIERLKEYDADFFLTFAYGLILPENFLNFTKMSGLNIHPSMLPDLRGASPLQSALLRNYNKIGITIQKVALRVDSGDIIFQKELDIADNDDILSLEQKVKRVSADIIVPVLKDYYDCRIKPVPQDDKKITYCRQFNKSDGLINWDNSADKILGKIKAFAKWPVAFTFFDKKKLSIYKAEKVDLVEEHSSEPGTVICATSKQGLVIKTGNGYLKLISIQIEGKKMMNYKDFLNGHKNILNKRLISE